MTSRPVTSLVRSQESDNVQSRVHGGFQPSLLLESTKSYSLGESSEWYPPALQNQPQDLMPLYTRLHLGKAPCFHRIPLLERHRSVRAHP